MEVTVPACGEHERRRVGCLAGRHGCRSAVRKPTGSGFPGTVATTFSLLTESARSMAGWPMPGGPMAGWPMPGGPIHRLYRRQT
ncbi:hypothetical protein CP973_21160 [Streptomyces albofaciens JCM 4342]|nr:hypothetical protein CP973_21160 [Streptomyces albofaciens JCM 4342]